MQRYRTRDGDTVDFICWKVYGREQATTEAVLDANPGLAQLGAILGAGIVIQLPDLPDPPTNRVVRVWG